MGGFPVKTFAVLLVLFLLLMSSTTSANPTISFHGDEKSLWWLSASLGERPRKV
uniref:Uncharacterized protein n=1 Tax=Nelumbo nucifera TaxID=4432 RepID=A0A822ZT55_NELNU|nr:TPA_asm: hypothetical protein HUJ06_018369 [Nelumbo nucifera]